MPREIQIVKTEIVIPVDKEENDYHDILFHDKAGKEYKISNKRAQLGEKIIPGHAVELGYGNYMNHDFIAQVRLVEEHLPPPIKSERQDEPLPKPEPIRIISGEERGMWFKELGNRIGDGSLDRDYPKAHIKIKQQYYKKMSEITRIDFQA